MATPLITLVTGNKGKLTEMLEILDDKQSIRFETCKIDLDELQGATPQEIAKAKALNAYRMLGRPVLIDDTSLCFNALGGLPGPYIKWFLDKMGKNDLPKLLSGFEDKSGFASCVFTLCVDESTVLHFDGRCNGKIVDPRGDYGFGWDPIFEAEDTGLTFAEMTAEIKNKVSHRCRALKLFADFFESEEGKALLTRMATVQ